MTGITLMSLGDNIFYVPLPEYDTPGYESLQRDSTYTWVPQGRLNAPVAMQFTGPGQDTIVIEGRLFPHHFGGISTLKALRDAGAAGKPLPLMRFYPVQDEGGGVIQGFGPDGNRLVQGTSGIGIISESLGDFAIIRVRTGEKNISSVGLANHIDFAIELAAYGNDSKLVSQGTGPVTNSGGQATPSSSGTVSL